MLFNSSLVSGALARSLRSDPRGLFGALHLDFCLDLDDLPLRLFLLRWLLEEGEAEIQPFSGLAALLLVLLLHDALEALVPVSSLLPAAARRDFSPWLAAATAALETHRDWLHPAILRRWHGSLATDIAGLITGLMTDWQRLACIQMAIL